MCDIPCDELQIHFATLVSNTHVFIQRLMNINEMTDDKFETRAKNTIKSKVAQHIQNLVSESQLPSRRSQQNDRNSTNQFTK